MVSTASNLSPDSSSFPKPSPHYIASHCLSGLAAALPSECRCVRQRCSQCRAFNSARRYDFWCLLSVPCCCCIFFAVAFFAAACPCAFFAAASSTFSALLCCAAVHIHLAIPTAHELRAGTTGLLVSTALITIFGEILPQATCSRYGLGEPQPTD